MIPLGNGLEIHISMRGTLFVRDGKQDHVIHPTDFADLISSYLKARTQGVYIIPPSLSCSSSTLSQHQSELEYEGESVQP